MAKVAFPDGMQLAGRLGNLVFCRRNGGMYVRTRVTPKNPRSPEQRKNRGRFAEAVARWRELPEEDKQRYRERAQWQSRTGYHLFLAEQLSGS